MLFRLTIEQQPDNTELIEMFVVDTAIRRFVSNFKRRLLQSE